MACWWSFETCSREGVVVWQVVGAVWQTVVVVVVAVVCVAAPVASLPLSSVVVVASVVDVAETSSRDETASSSPAPTYLPSCDLGDQVASVVGVVVGAWRSSAC